ncbi:MAG: site-2 protease family protein, partial [Planctomycetota bacterium]|nr:site-2 protease family protein [Planctomycetota bacterium]
MLEHVTIARIAGIPVRANLLLGYLLAFWAIMGASSGRAELTLTLIGLSMGLLLLHELGHALMARRLGLQVVDIVLWPLGGMARISDFPADARVEAWVAAAGPLVNLTLAALVAPLLLFTDGVAFEFSAGIGIGVSPDGGGVLSLFVLINLAFGLINLLPAFPMDGGRLLRSFLARGGRDWVAATDRATSVGSVIAWSMIIMFILRGEWLLSLLGFFILFAGLKERWTVRLRHQAEQMGGGAGRFAGWESLLRQRAGAFQGAGGPPEGAAGASPFPTDGPLPGGLGDEAGEGPEPQGDGF